MKKKTVFKIVLVLLPILAVALATTVNSVTVVDKATGTTAYYSYFELIPDELLQMLPPLAGTLCIVTGVFAIGAAVSRKGWWLTGVKWLALAASIAAVAPILVQGREVTVLPNVGVPVMMLAEWVAAFYAARQPEQADDNAPRLSDR